MNKSELYNLKDDIGGSKTLFAQHPEKVQELSAAATAFDKTVTTF